MTKIGERTKKKKKDMVPPKQQMPLRRKEKGSPNMLAELPGGQASRRHEGREAARQTGAGSRARPQTGVHRQSSGRVRCGQLCT